MEGDDDDEEEEEEEEDDVGGEGDSGIGCSSDGRSDIRSTGTTSPTALPTTPTSFDEAVGDVDDETDEASTPLMTRFRRHDAGSVASAGEDDAGWTSANNDDDDDDVSEDPTIIEGVLEEEEEEEEEKEDVRNMMLDEPLESRSSTTISPGLESRDQIDELEDEEPWR